MVFFYIIFLFLYLLKVIYLFYLIYMIKFKDLKNPCFKMVYCLRDQIILMYYLFSMLIAIIKNRRT